MPVDYYSSGVSCGQCQVVIPDPWYDKLNRVLSFEENRMVRQSLPSTSHSRLACCVRVMPDLNEMIVVVGNNEEQTGEWFTGRDPAAF